ncbi:cobalt-precorrin 5A hydrolase [Desulfonema magnum]|uniref:Cobalamin biosynthesis protein n=1 Tax=Desulfonema magnum TaxID=45655 RepID=A0A975BMZ0_9BACT|nr:cobalt-precorrin 5A hydrolase [Desulfonema magnum]QTA88684.1 Cobalamin biosynthesis protein [Desulfonema magnum]
MTTHKLAIWAVTPNGAKLARRISAGLSGADLHFSASLENEGDSSATFETLSGALSQAFDKYNAHIFIMSAGIVVRLVAPHIRHKTSDPAVVVADEKGYHVISLLSGHIGGANALAKQIAEIIDATPVITTATDLNKVPAIDLLAKEKGLFIENPDAIKYVSMAFLKGKKICCHDPFQLMSNTILSAWFSVLNSQFSIFIDDVVADLPPHTLILRPKSLVAGIGCNRNTDKKEIKELLYEVLEKNALARGSLKCIATVDLKADEQGLLALGQDLNLPLEFFTREELEKVKDIKTPSAMVEKHIGVKSVCEASAILATKKGKLIVPKHSTRNVTVAIARIPFTS